MLRANGEVIHVSVQDVLDIDKLRRDHPVNRCTHVIAIGGDGTVNAAVPVAVRFKKKLLVIPSGTFNHFAKHAGIPLSPDQAFRLLDTGHTDYLDVSSVNDRLFINFASLGFYTDIIADRSRQQRQGGRKWPSFLRALVQQTFSGRRLKMNLSINGKPGEARVSPLVFVGNGVYEFGSADILHKRESLQDHRLQLVIMKNYSKPRLLWIGFLALFMDIKRLVSVDTCAISECEMTFSNRKKVTVVLDGEVMTCEPTLHFKVHNQVLPIVLPRED